MSERSLARLIKGETGLSFGQWRKQWQIIVALQSLAEGESVQQTAEALGYESVSSFITMFRKTLGEPPARYVRGTAVRQYARGRERWSKGKRLGQVRYNHWVHIDAKTIKLVPGFCVAQWLPLGSGPAEMRRG